VADRGTWLVTGGAGYIGAHVLRALRAAGHRVVVMDDLSTGRLDRVPDDVDVVHGSLLDTALVTRVLREHDVTGVVHLAGKKAVEESVQRPLYYYRENIAGVLSLLEAMSASNVLRLVFSSSAAVYGAPATLTVDENDPTVPLTPYGRSKLFGEWMVADAARAGEERAGISAISLRYFNVVGCAEPALADQGGPNLFPRVVEAIRRGRRPVIYGTDYPTPDGTCVRDYIHVVDLARAHLSAVQLTAGAAPGARVLNVGRGRGYSVLEVLDAFRRVTRTDIVPRIEPRRPGDPAAMVAAVERAHALLSWRAQHDLDVMVTDAWRTAHVLPSR